MYSPHYSVILSNVGYCCDRYMTKGYSNPFEIEELFDRVASIEHVKGVELIGGSHITEKNVDQIKGHLQRTGLKLVSIIPDHFSEQKWGKGAFTSKDKNIRKDAINVTKTMMDVAVELGGDLISLWPGQDGYDYSFQADYIEERSWFEEGVKEACRHRKDVNVAIEYKPKEPRNRSYPSNVTSTLLMTKEIGESNCGITIDYGHALVAYENVAESVGLIEKYKGQLMHVHMNDNYGFWDDDMIVGSIHTIPYIEFLYWLKRTNYSGWISMDQYPYREESREAVNESIQWMVALEKVMQKMDEKEVEQVIKGGNAVEANKMIRKYLLG